MQQNVSRFPCAVRWAWFMLLVACLLVAYGSVTPTNVDAQNLAESSQTSRERRPASHPASYSHNHSQRLKKQPKVFPLQSKWCSVE